MILQSRPTHHWSPFPSIVWIADLCVENTEAFFLIETVHYSCADSCIAHVSFPRHYSVRYFGLWLRRDFSPVPRYSCGNRRIFQQVSDSSWQDTLLKTSGRITGKLISGNFDSFSFRRTHDSFPLSNRHDERPQFRLGESFDWEKNRELVVF